MRNMRTTMKKSKRGMGGQVTDKDLAMINSLASRGTVGALSDADVAMMKRLKKVKKGKK